jgi:hypothetical protein
MSAPMLTGGKMSPVLVPVQKTSEFIDPNDIDPNRVTNPDEIAEFLNDYFGQTDPTGQSQVDEEYFDSLPQEMQWLIEDEAAFRSLVRDYLTGTISYEELLDFKLADYGDAGTKFVDFHNQAVLRLAPPEVKQTLWETEILPAIEAGGDFVKTAIFGPAPSGGPRSIDELFEEWMNGTLDQMKGPLTVTVDPKEGLLLEILIPVNFEVNGEPLKIKIFDENGNFVGVEEIAEAVWNGTWGVIKDGVFQPIEDIFTGTEGTVVERIFDAAESVLVTTGQAGVEQGGWLGGVLTEEILGPYFFDEGTNTIEEGEEGTLDPDSDLMGEDPTGTAGQDPVDANNDGIDDNTGLPIVEDPTEDEPPAKVSTPRGRSIVDKEGNIVGISGDDGNFYVQDAEGNWVVQPEGVDVGGEAELPADTTIEEDGPVKDEVRVGEVDPLSPPEGDTKVQQPSGRVITDKEGNIVGISGDDGNFYVQDAQGNWVVRPEGLGDGGGNRSSCWYGC